MNKTLKRIWEVVAYSEILAWQMPEKKIEENQESTSIVTTGPLAEV